MAPDLLPSDVLSPPKAARKRVALIAAAAMGSAALAGIWLRAEDGLLMRLVLATTSAVFAWLVMEVALSAQDATGAFGRAIGMSIVTGAVNTVIPSIILCAHESSVPFAVCLVAGGICGAFVGFGYGILLGILAAATWRRVNNGTHDGADRAVTIAAAWAALPVLLIGWVAFGYDLSQSPISEWTPERDVAARSVAFPLGLLGMGIAFWVPLISFGIASGRLDRRRKWLASVTSGHDHRWGIREVGPHDDLTVVPRLREGHAVLEHKNEHAIYRATATGDAVAII